MIDPLCRDCKTRHPLGAENCPLYKEVSKKTVEKILKEVIPHTPESTKSGTHKSKPYPQTLSTEGGAKFDRNAYQREYMRKWRAKRNG